MPVRHKALFIAFSMAPDRQVPGMRPPAWAFLDSEYAGIECITFADSCGSEGASDLASPSELPYFLIRHHPDLLLVAANCLDVPPLREMLEHARQDKIATIVLVQGPGARDPGSLAEADAVVVPSAFAAAYYREAFEGGNRVKAETGSERFDVLKAETGSERFDVLKRPYESAGPKLPDLASVIS